MRLADYLHTHELTGAAFAERVGVDDATINRLIPKDGKKQVRRPSLDLVQRIHDATGGEVSGNDWLDPTPEPTPQAAQETAA